MAIYHHVLQESDINLNSKYHGIALTVLKDIYPKSFFDLSWDMFYSVKEIMNYVFIITYFEAKVYSFLMFLKNKV